MLVKYITAAVIGIFTILIYYRIDKIGYQGFQNLSGFFMMMSMNFVMIGISNAIQVFPDQRVIFMKEHGSGQYSVTAYYLSYFITSFPFAVIIPTITTVIGYLFTFLISGMDITVKKFFIFCKGVN